LKDFGQGVGFATSAKTAAKATYSQSVIENALRKVFAPEFLNRIDDVVIFESLQKEDIFKIIDIELAHLYNRINELGYHLQLTDDAKDFIAEKGWDEQYGARPLKRAIQKFVEDMLAEEIIKSTLNTGDKITLGLNDDKSELTLEIKKPDKPVAVDD
jgi:ATP-dependent Clp protease ATP-binding subunit ClpC